MLFVNGRAEVSHTAWFAVNFYSLCFLIGTRNLIRTNTLGKKQKTRVWLGIVVLICQD